MEKIPVGILGATGVVGQKFVSLLQNHPWFEIVALAASDRSQGKKYSDVIGAVFPESISNLPLVPCRPNLPCQLVFSALDASVAYDLEQAFAQAGYMVVSNSRQHRMEANVPLLIPEVNDDHLRLLSAQPYAPGGIVTNPNCSVIGLAMALKPWLDLWGIEETHIVTLQAISGAGYPGLPSLDILDNVIPYIADEESKLETEPLKIFGTYHHQNILPYPLKISSQCTRVAVTEGHMACISVRLKHPATREGLIHAWETFQGEPQVLQLPSAPKQPLIYWDDARYPQPRLHRHVGQGMTVSLGRLRPCSLLDWKFVVLSHNTVRGAAGCAILNAELLYAKGYLQHCHSALQLSYVAT